MLQAQWSDFIHPPDWVSAGVRDESFLTPTSPLLLLLGQGRREESVWWMTWSQSKHTVEALEAQQGHRSRAFFPPPITHSQQRKCVTVRPGIDIHAPCPCLTGQYWYLFIFLQNVLLHILPFFFNQRYPLTEETGASHQEHCSFPVHPIDWVELDKTPGVTGC